MKFREVLIDRYEEKLIITTDLDPCLVAYPLKNGFDRREGQKSPMMPERGERFYEIFLLGGDCFADWIAKAVS